MSAINSTCSKMRCWAKGIALGVLTVCATAIIQGRALGQTCPSLIDLRVRFMDHSTFEQAVESERAASKAAKTADPDCALYCEAHQWVSFSRAADFGWNMAERYTRFKKGMSKLDSLVNTHPDDNALRALRLSVSGTAPRFLGEDTHWEADANAVMEVSETDFWAKSPIFSEWMSELAASTLEQLGITP